MSYSAEPLNARLESLTPLQRAFLKCKELERRLERALHRDSEPVAIIGFACRFPGGANSPEALWDLLRDGVDLIREVPTARWGHRKHEGVDGKVLTRFGGIADGMDLFDAEFFGISPTECFHLDPQQRVALMVVYEAIERACVVPESLVGSRTGVFFGVSNYEYALRMASDGGPSIFGPYHGSGNSASGVSGRLSYFFGLQGPCMSIDTACSSSMVAIHQGCASLRSGECDLSLCGGVNFLTAVEAQISLSKAGMVAKDGRCKTFDARADGYVRSEGCGVVVLKRLSDAERDGDPILALIRGSAIGQDGRSGGLTVPNRAAQESLIQSALAKAGLTTDALDYIEAHGTGTPLGDPIEVDAIAAVLAKAGISRDPVLIGSVKSNLGHLEAAAGIAGIGKVILALQNEAIPPHLHVQNLNPRIAWDAMPIRVNTRLREWKRSERPRIAGVSSFGFTGSLCHMILQEAPPKPASAESSAGEVCCCCITLSATSEPALRDLAAKYLNFLERESPQLEDVAYTANLCRASYSHRLAIVASTREDLRQSLTRFLEQIPDPHVHHGFVTADALSTRPEETHLEAGSEAAAAALAEAFVQGGTIDWRAKGQERGGRKIQLPTYPFQLKRYWYTGDAAAQFDGDYFRENAYVVAWHPLPEIGPPSPTAADDLWIILADREGVWVDFNAALLANGSRSRVLFDHDFRGLSDELARTGVEHVAGVASFVSLNIPDQTKNATQAESEVENLLAVSLSLLQASSELPVLRPKRMVFVTSGAMSVQAGQAVHPERAALWGFGRAVQLEVPETVTTLVDLEQGAERAAGDIWKRVLADASHEQIAIRDSQVWIPELRRLKEQPSAGRLSISNDRGAWYLIVGGLGTLGIGAAEWLAGLGAKRLVLTSRHRRSLGVRAGRLRALQDRGVEIEIVEIDAADGDATRQLVNGRRAAGDALHGVILTAGVTRPAPLMETSPDALREVCRAKVAAARVIHDTTLDEPLEFFISFSSIASVWGSALLAGYSAANAYLDALAHWRHSLGLPFTSVNWGPWEESGMVAQHDGARSLERRGVRMLEPGRTFGILETLVQTRAPQVVFASIDWKAFLSLLELHRPSVFWDSIRPEVQAPAVDARLPRMNGSTPPFVKEFSSLPGGERKEHLRSRVISLLASVLGHSHAGAISVVHPFQEQGMDSILVQEFAVKLSSLLGLEVRASLMFEYPTVQDLVEHLFGELQPKEPQAGEPALPDETAGPLAKLDDEELLDLVMKDLRRFA
jgi:acyl transferase domain-containing protein/NAD(P)-dependent dehydrogenase (short-subunit alcohol dehydrogenase family)